MTELRTIPQFPVPKRETQLIFSLASGANFARIWVTEAPTGSALKQQLLKATLNRVEVATTNGGEAFPWKQIFDVGGKYTLIVQEYLKGSGYGGGYEGDPNGAESETKIGGENTIALFIGQRLTQKIGPGSDSATLVLWVWDTVIRRTTLAFHGEESPAIVAQSPSPKARTAIESASVRAALVALRDIEASVAVGSMGPLVSDYVIRWNFHVTNTGFHANGDTNNELPVGLANASTPSDLQTFVNTALAKMRAHFSNDNGQGVDSADYHNPSASLTVDDWADMPLYRSVGSLEDAYGGFADLHRCYEVHRASLAYHSSADTTALTALPLLAQVHAAYLAILALAAPATPPAQSDGAMALIGVAGFKEA